MSQRRWYFLSFRVLCMHLDMNWFNCMESWKRLTCGSSGSCRTIWGNRFNCKLPPELGNLVNLTYLWVAALNKNWCRVSLNPYLWCNLDLGHLKCNLQPVPPLCISAPNVLKWFWPSEVDANCYENPGAHGTLDVQCSRELCIPFHKYLSSNGGCPLCPNGQYIANQTLCICFGGSTHVLKAFLIFCFDLLSLVLGHPHGARAHLGVVILVQTRRCPKRKLPLPLLWRCSRSGGCGASPNLLVGASTKKVRP